MLNIADNALITYQETTSAGLWADNHFYPYQQLQDYYCFYYPQFPVYIENKVNKTELAFKIAGKLLEEKIIEGLTAKKLIELVRKISEII